MLAVNFNLKLTGRQTLRAPVCSDSKTPYLNRASEMRA